jgi:hypothetical protein
MHWWRWTSASGGEAVNDTLGALKYQDDIRQVKRSAPHYPEGHKLVMRNPC